MKKVLFILFIIFSLVGISQNNRTIDSLETTLKNSKEDTAKIKLLYDLAFEYNFHDVEHSLKYSQQALDLSQKLNYPLGISMALSCKAMSLKRSGAVDKALTIYKELLKTDEENGLLERAAKDHNNIATVYTDLAMYDKAIPHYFAALKYFEKKGDKLLIASLYLNLGNTYSASNDASKKGVEFFNKALVIFEQLKDKYRYAMTLQSLGSNLGNNEKRKEALVYLKRSLDLLKQLNLNYEAANLYISIASQYAYTFNYKLAVKYAYQGLNEYKQFGDSLGIANAYTALGNSYFNEADNYDNPSQKKPFYNAAIKYYDSASIYLTNIEARAFLTQIYHIKAESFAGLKRFDSASVYFRRLASWKDTIYNIEKNRQFENTRAGYELEKKEQDNFNLQQENKIQSLEINKNRYLLFGLIIVLILVILIALLLIRQNKLRSQQKGLQLEQKLLRVQMNPHFIFNSLIAIESFIYKNEPKEAGKYLSGFARLMRLILENSREEFVSLEKEINTLEHYFKLQKLRYDDNFNYSIEIDKNIDTGVLLIPPMLAQPFIENSIEHGLKNNSVKGEITVRFSLHDGEILFSVEDNGIGFERSVSFKKENEAHKSLATKITQERLEILNKKRNKKVKFIIEDIKDHLNNISGARVTFSIPYTQI